MYADNFNEKESLPYTFLLMFRQKTLGFEITDEAISCGAVREAGKTRRALR